MNTVFRSRRAVLPSGEEAADVVVRHGRIAAVEPYGTMEPSGGELVDIGDLALLPGLVDTHVHINEPGRTEWEGFETATAAAAAGGVTTLLDMPLNSLPPTTTAENLAAKQRAAAGKLHVDVGFWGGAIGTNTTDLAELHAAGVFGFKAFLAPSGVPEFPRLDADGLDEVLTEVARLGTVLVVHAEDADVLAEAPQPDGQVYGHFLDTRPPAAEHRAVATLVGAAKRSGARVHVLHVSSATVLPVVAAARLEGVAVSAETCPHYLLFAAEEVPDGATSFKCCPPIRAAVNRDALWGGLAAGVLDLVVSDHSPCPPELKRLDTGDFGAAWGGISGLQVGLAAVWAGASARGHGLGDVVRWMASGPAAFAGLVGKGAIEPGKDADLFAFDPDPVHVVDPADLRHRHKVTPYAGTSVRGVVQGTWLRGERVDGVVPHGQMLHRSITFSRRSDATPPSHASCDVANPGSGEEIR